MPQFLFNKVPFLSYIEGHVLVGAAGAVTSIAGNGVKSVSLLATGIYQIQLTQNYNALLGSSFQPQSPANGISVTAGSFVTNALYQITALGNTNWAAIGLQSGLTAKVGQVFVATGAGSGTGTAQLIVASNADQVEIPINPQVMLSNSQTPVNQGSIVLFETFAVNAISFTGNTGSGNANIGIAGSLAGLYIGQLVSGPGIQVPSTIISLTPGTGIAISQNATNTASAASLVATPGKVLTSPVSGTIIRFNLFLRNSSAQY